MKWNWDSCNWKRSNKILLLGATLWPVVYLVLFIGGIFSMMVFMSFAENRDHRSCGYLDVLQLDLKIKNGEIKQLNLRPDEIIAIDRVGNCEFEARVTNEDTRREILKDAREIVNGQPRVEKIDEQTSRPTAAPPLPFIPLGFVSLMAVHMLTILLMMAMMPLYIILAVNNERLDQTMKIVWVVLLCTMGMFAMPVYWYLYVWRKPTAKPEAESGAKTPGDNTPAAA